MKTIIKRLAAISLAAAMLPSVLSGCSDGSAAPYSTEPGCLMIENFENIAGLEPPYEFAVNKNGGECRFSLLENANAEGGYAMQMMYNYGGAGYAGATIDLGSVDLSGYDGLKIWCSTDGTGNSLTIQIKDNDDKSWEAVGYMDAVGATELIIPYSCFKAPSWDSSLRDPFDPALGIQSISIYTNRIGEGDEIGAVSIDAIRACDFEEGLADARVELSTRLKDIKSFPCKIKGTASGLSFVTLQVGSAQINLPVVDGKWSYELTEKDGVYHEPEAEVFAFAQYWGGKYIAKSAKQTVSIDVDGDFSDVKKNNIVWEEEPVKEIIDIATDEMINDAKASLSPVMEGQTVSVLDFINEISGKYTLSGIHNREPNADTLIQTNEIISRTGLTPGLWSGDFLFTADDVAHRWDMIHECERQWNEGSVVQLMLHVTSPLSDETGAWDGDVLSKLTDEQWEELITDGSELNNVWKKRLDGYAEYMQYLKDAGVTFLFRPFHEMNQGQFWWGGRPGDNGTAALYRLTRDYLEKEKGLDNIVWVWDMQDLDYKWADYNPGSDYFDIFAVDFYNGDGYTAKKYQTALEVAGDKPIAIGECDVLPTAAELEKQPRWVFFMSWSELTFENNDSDQIRALYNAENVLVKEELPAFN